LLLLLGNVSNDLQDVVCQLNTRVLLLPLKLCPVTGFRFGTKPGLFPLIPVTTIDHSGDGESEVFDPS